MDFWARYLKRGCPKRGPKRGQNRVKIGCFDPIWTPIWGSWRARIQGGWPEAGFRPLCIPFWALQPGGGPEGSKRGPKGVKIGCFSLF